MDIEYYKIYENELNFKQKFYRIEELYDKEIQNNDFKKMSYQSYLYTDFWQIIAKMKRYLADYKCQKCNDKNELHIHHLDYSIIGEEFIYIYDNTKLLCLCERCHDKIHRSKNEMV